VGRLQKVILIFPCYNEAARFDPDRFRDFGNLPGVSLLFVNDGSTDATEKTLRSFCRTSGALADVLCLDRNRGKGEAVRRGMLHALELGARVVGYIDADLSTPMAEVGRMLATLQAEPLSVLMGSRIQYLGTSIERSPLRHYIGRLFATVASVILDIPVYDTQCGAKLLRSSPSLRGALAEPFVSRWCFDVELLGRLLIGASAWSAVPLDQVREFPLREWHDVPDSKLGLRDSVRIAVELARVALDLSARRRARQAAKIA
jgi:dolichyl-phosphate beta-glucosyltransferase